MGYTVGEGEKKCSKKVIDYGAWLAQVSLGLRLEEMVALISVILTLSNILLSKVSGLG